MNTIDHHDDHDHMRMDDDGAPPPRIIPINIGIAPAAPVVKPPDLKAEEKAPIAALHRGEGVEPAAKTFEDARREQQAAFEPERRARQERYDAALATQQAARPALVLVGPSTGIVGADGNPVTSLTWPVYNAWRQTKTKRRNLGDYPEQVEELDQATHEFIGELAELAELVGSAGPAAFYEPTRAKLIDECGDCFFCGTWAAEAWLRFAPAGAVVNPLATEQPEFGVELFITDESNPGLPNLMARALATNPLEVVAADRDFLSNLGVTVLAHSANALMYAGLTSNAFKKLAYQERSQDVEEQVDRIVSALVNVNMILLLASSTVAEALRVNQAKLNARYPDGFKPGGGIRTP
jgi:hypothetical protein